MSNLTLHRGAVEISKDDLDLIPLPEATESYTPVSHYQLAGTLATIGRDILSDYLLVSEQYAVAKQGNQLFAVLNFNKNNSDMALSVGFRNSYDRSMSIGLAIGATVFVCDNLALCGDIAVMRKHTKNVWSALEDLAITTLYKSQHTYNKIIADSDNLKSRQMLDDEAFKFIGLLYGRGVLSPRQIPVVKDGWLKPAYQEFEARTGWSFYNACTEALKSTAPLSTMEKHLELHRIMTEEGNYVWQR